MTPSAINAFVTQKIEKKNFKKLQIFSSTMEMNISKQHPIVHFTLSTRFKDLVFTFVIYNTTLMEDTRFAKLGLNQTLITQIISKKWNQGTNNVDVK